MASRHRTPSSQIEGKILDAALHLLDEEGFPALTVRRIASEASVAPMGIYNRFESKTGVMDALWIEGFERLTDALSLTTPGIDPVEDIIERGRRYRRFALDNPSYYRLMFMRSATGYEPSPKAIDVAIRAFDALLSLITRAQDAGFATRGTERDIAQQLWAVVHGHVALELLGLTFADDGDVAFEQSLAAIRDYLS
jgi:AcrR family transcriptional regulator